jgi:hypothetical protein
LKENLSSGSKDIKENKQTNKQTHTYNDTIIQFSLQSKDSTLKMHESVADLYGYAGAAQGDQPDGTVCCKVDM